VAYRKALLLQKAGAQLRIVALNVCDDLRVLLDVSTSTLIERAFVESDIDGCRLVIAATDDSDLNQRISDVAQQRQVPVNVVDCPELCSYITPSIVERGPVTVAISSSGMAPVLARSLRAKIESWLPASYGDLAEIAGRYRERVKQCIKTEAGRRKFWEKIFSGSIAERLFAGNRTQAEQMLEQQLRCESDKNELDSGESSRSESTVGEVYLVGAGPGDPELLTLKALRLMQECDLVLYDRLVSDEIMDLVRRDAKRIYVGKQRADHAVPQPEISQMLVDFAREGKKVLRLKGGDPFIFGRGGEELALLAANKIPFQVVPGITAASGCAAYAGIPLTHRDHAQSVRFITGHLRDDSANLNWPELAQPKQTLVFYMGLRGLPDICRALIKAGSDPETPAALIGKGTTQRQRVLTGDLNSLPNIVAAQNAHAPVHAPTLLIIGGVVALHQSLQWFKGS